VRVLEATLRLAHPIIPFITESIWQQMKELAGKSGDTIMLATYPAPREDLINTEAEADIAWLQGVITAVRNIRAEKNIGPSKELDLILKDGDDDDFRRADENQLLLMKLARLGKITWHNDGDDLPMSTTQLVGQMEVLVPMAGFIDKDKEIARLEKELDRLDGEIQRIANKLGSEGFVAKAPAAVIEKEKEKLVGFERDQGKIKEQIEAIKAL
jgi:valyl-tRNA synthetase